MLKNGSHPRSPERGHVLLLGNYMPSLTVARSLSAAGFRVIAGDGGEFSTISFSRRCDEIWEHPPIAREDAFMAALLSLLDRRPEIRAVLPLQERYVALLATQGSRLPSHVALLMPDGEVVQTCLDKGRMYRLAEAVGVPFPRLRTAVTLEELDDSASDVGYPCVVRPNESGVPLPGGRKALICRDDADLRSLVPEWPDSIDRLLVQPYVAGLRHNVHFVARQGRILARVETASVQTDRLDGTGIGVQGLSVAADPVMRRHSDALIEGLGYTGVGLAQFIVTPAGDVHFLEVNPRHGIALALTKRCGLDLALASCELAGLARVWDMEGGDDYPVGVRYVWTSMYLHSIRGMWRDGTIGLGEAARRFARAIAAAIRADVHATWTWSDPLPTVAIFMQWLPGPWRRTPLSQREDS